MLQQVNATVTNSAAVVTGLPGSASYLQIHNPHATATIAYTFDGSTPVINGNGITLAALGTDTRDQPGGTVWSGSIKAISSVASQAVTIIWGNP
jgi:hypothetical protein